MVEWNENRADDVADDGGGVLDFDKSQFTNTANLVKEEITPDADIAEPAPESE
jgi:hypothetical protein